MERIDIRQARPDDLVAIGRVFLAAFPESVAFYTGRAIPPAAPADLFAICLASEPDAFFVAEVGGEVRGYVFAPAHFSHLTRAGLRSGLLFRMLGHWVGGRYGFGLRPVFASLRNWLSLLRESSHQELSSDARILSIAVDPRSQGQGLGKGLMTAGMDYLASRHVSRVRLEVRPNNPSARRLYEKYGFITRGETRDLQGPWLIMLKDMAEDPQTRS